MSKKVRYVSRVASHLGSIPNFYVVRKSSSRFYKSSFSHIAHSGIALYFGCVLNALWIISGPEARVVQYITFRISFAIIYAMEKYMVYVDDNFHNGDESERYKLGEFETREEALVACKAKVDEFFERIKKGEHSFKELWEGYMLYGEDPFIINDDSECKFSAWEYAKQRCLEYAA